MAVSKLWAVNSRLGQVIDYAANPEKTAADIYTDEQYQALADVACIIFSLFASSPPVVNPDAAAVTQVWSYIGELVFNMLVLVGAVKMSDRIIREMMGL